MHSSTIVAETGRFLPQLAQVIKVQLTVINAFLCGKCIESADSSGRCHLSNCTTL